MTPEEAFTPDWIARGQAVVNAREARSKRVTRVVLVAVVFFIGLGFYVHQVRNTPEAQYLSAMHAAAPAGAATEDVQYLKLGYDVCSIYRAKGWNGVDALLTGIDRTRGRETRQAWTTLALMATEHLCYVEAGYPSTWDPPAGE